MAKRSFSVRLESAVGKAVITYGFLNVLESAVNAWRKQECRGNKYLDSLETICKDVETAIDNHYVRMAERPALQGPND